MTGEEKMIGQALGVILLLCLHRHLSKIGQNFGSWGQMRTFWCGTGPRGSMTALPARSDLDD